MPKTSPTTAPCPICDGAVPVEDGLMLNEILSCPECGAELEVSSLSPLTLEQAPEVEEDWGE